MVRRYCLALVATGFLLGAEVLAQSKDAWPLSVEVDRGQEFVYRGTFVEQGRYGTVQFRRAYRLHSRVFILRKQFHNIEVAFLTTFKRQHNDEEPNVAPDLSQSSVRLTTVSLDPKGNRKVEPGKDLAVPLEGVPTIETGSFVVLPKDRIRVGESWEVYEVGRPVQVWKLTGLDRVRGKLCLLVESRQESREWKNPRADRAGWLRRDKVWLSPQEGLALRVERTIERREPARTETTHRSVLTYERESALHYPGQLSSDRREEIVLANTLSKESAPWMSQPSKYKAQLERLLERIEYHVERQPPTPYREAIEQVQRELEMARKGRVPAHLVANNPTPRFATVGKPAPAFVATSFTAERAARPQNWLGKPTLLVFYLPSSITSKSLLAYLQQLERALPREMHVVGLAVSDDAREVLAQRKRMGLTFEMINGNGLRKTYNIETTPKFILLDASGVVRATHLGWGLEIPREIAAELKHLLKQK